MNARRPNPGSEEARELGCTCAVMDNNWGKYPPFEPDNWWITAGCPVHNPQDAAFIQEPLIPEGEPAW